MSDLQANGYRRLDLNRTAAPNTGPLDLVLNFVATTYTSPGIGTRRDMCMNAPIYILLLGQKLVDRNTEKTVMENILPQYPRLTFSSSFSLVEALLIAPEHVPVVPKTSSLKSQMSKRVLEQVLYVS